ncbi:phosphoribosylglycinamide formyltransferase [Sphingomonas alba]|uniref:Phosphoribosylglycinamide formyltransferase n=1 Tax=Sphingomonas alba TaxID=2908208 RepID=A0ABT0RJK1_9SPHN|nr:phosphoribosylglycinamide formyltransferase [Sphingomonas alba]MCL6682793.1 phosphoribosylglycinamide formyltransferase [Sphingomonas alba]
MSDPKRVAILISGRGSNMKALIEQARGYEVVLVASNKVHAPGLDTARALGVPTFAFEAKRDEFEAALERSLADHKIGTIALAGYMRILSAAFIGRWRGRILNIHPSLLPRHKGLDTHNRVLAAGETVSGCTVHLVSEELDSGDVIAQTEVPVESGDDASRLAARVLEAEHYLYPKALSEFVRR